MDNAKGLDKVNWELTHLHTGITEVTVRHEKNGRIVTWFFFISLLLGSCISPDAFGEKPATPLEQGARAAGGSSHIPTHKAQRSTARTLICLRLPPDPNPPTDLSKRNNPAESQHLKHSFLQDSVVFALLQKMAERHYWIGRNNPAHISNPIFPRKTNKPTSTSCMKNSSNKSVSATEM